MNFASLRPLGWIDAAWLAALGVAGLGLILIDCTLGFDALADAVLNH